MKKAVFGIGGHAREVISLLPFSVDIFVDDEYCAGKTLPISSFNPEEYEIMICIGDSLARKSVVDRLPSETRFFSFVHPTATVVDESSVREGSFVGPYSFISCNVKMGAHCILNRGCHVGHDAVLGDYVSMMSNSVISGNCLVGEGCYMGNNSSIREKTTVCQNVKLGMNTAVVKNIVEPGIYVGVPSKKIKL